MRRVLVSSAGFLILLGIPATGPAQAPGVGALKQRSAELAARSQEAVVQLYALESRLRQSQDDLARIDARAATLAREQESAARRFRAARRTMAIAQQRLGRQLRILYEQDEPDPFAVILGASSLDEAIEGLESISRTARATESVIGQARTARKLIRKAQEELAVRVDRTRAVREKVAATAAGLEQARNERSSYLAGLRREQALTASQISDLERRAAEAQQKAQQVTQQAAQAATAEPTTTAAAAPPAPATTSSAETTTDSSQPPPPPVDTVTQASPVAPAPAAPPPVRAGGTMTVLATAYCLKGTTATGLPVGPGIVAVDPTVIPLGTRMTIPGYGEGVAADVGGGVKGAHIDVWMASCKDALNFTRTVTITFH